MSTFKRLLKICRLFPKALQFRVKILMVGMLCVAAVELIGVGSIVPFIILISKPEKMLSNQWCLAVFDFFNITTTGEVVVFASISFLVLMFLVNIFKIILLYLVSLVGGGIRVHIFNSLFKYYMYQNYLYHALHNSTNLRENILTLGARVTISLQSQFDIIVKICLSMFIVLGLLAVNPTTVIVASIFFCTVYYVVQIYTKKRSQEYGVITARSSLIVSKSIHEGLTGIQDIKLASKEEVFINKFKNALQESLLANILVVLFKQIPRYFVEWIILLLFVLFIFVEYSKGSNLQEIMPVLSLYVLAGMRILPSFQDIYVKLTTIRNFESAFSDLGEELYDALKFNQNDDNLDNIIQQKIKFNSQISLQNIDFAYPGNQGKKVLDSISITIQKNTSIGFVGQSGSGKSTATYLLAGLIDSNNGCIKIDETILRKDNVKNWQAQIGYVPQMIFLSDSSILENIAFGISPNKINLQKVKEAAEKAELLEFVNELPEKFETLVGESGVRLSGGQRQRIGIARALYHNPEVLVFDEATSALDGETEQAIMDTMERFNKEKTLILVAHRFTTVKSCDVIYFFDKGKVVDSGTYEEVLSRNAKLRRMAGQTQEDENN